MFGLAAVRSRPPGHPLIGRGSHRESAPVTRRLPSRGALAALSLVIIGFIAVVVWLYPRVQIDKCLDRGGRWDYTTRECERPPRP